MQLIDSEKLDKNAWDQLVKQHKGSVFSLSAYLDATADNWAVLFNEDQSGGMACPFATKAGVNVLYNPFFHRYTEWIGANMPEETTVHATLREHFRVAEVQWRNTHLKGGDRVHQTVTSGELKYSQQAKRMLKKAANFKVREEYQPEQLLTLLQTELSPRIAGIDVFSLARLKQLAEAFHKHGLRQYNLFLDEIWCGGIWVIEFGETTLYLKGTTTAEAKNSGGMYLLIHTAINDALVNEKTFDFGGSNAEGVRRFNKTFGASDCTYRQVQWNNAPLWWKTLKTLRQKWNNR